MAQMSIETARPRVARRIGKYTLLLSSLLALLLIHGLSVTVHVGETLIEYVAVLVMAAGIYAVCQSRRNVAVGLALAALSAGATSVIEVLEPSSATAFWRTIETVSLGALVVWFVVLLLREIFTSRVVTADSIVGSICGYMLLAVLFSSLFSLVQVYVPDAFAVGGTPVAALDEERLMYFSFVTLSTLGYGDVTPAAPLAQDLVVLEAIAGQFYLTALVAILVGLRLSPPAPADSVQADSSYPPPQTT